MFRGNLDERFYSIDGTTIENIENFDCILQKHGKNVIEVI